MNREEPHLLSGAYALDALTPDEAADMERAIAASEDLRSEVAELTDTAVLLGLSVAPVEPSPGLRDRLLAAIETTPQLPTEPERAAGGREPKGTGEPVVAPAVTPAPAGPVGGGRATREAERRWFTRPSALVAAVAAAAALLFGAGVLVDGVLRPTTSQNGSVTFSEITAASDAHHKRARLTGGGEVSVYWSERLGASAVVVTGTAAPAGKTLQLWRMEGDDAASAGLYHPPSGERAQVIKGAMHKGQVFGITLEPAGGSPKPTSAPLVAIPIT